MLTPKSQLAWVLPKCFTSLPISVGNNEVRAAPGKKVELYIEGERAASHRNGRHWSPDGPKDFC